jgi:tetratricopeptide (TPR) repeat protein
MGYDELMELGHQYSSIGEFDVAAATFERALEIDSLSVEAHRGYQNAAMRLPDGREKVLQMYASLAERNPQNEMFQYLYGRVALEDEVSMDAFLRAVRLNPDFYWAHVGLAASYVDKEQFDNAVRHYEVAIRLRPSSPALIWLAETYVKTDNTARAEVVLRSALTSLEVQADRDEAYGMLFRLKRQNEDKEGMVEVAREILENASDPWMFNMASWTFVEAEENLELAVALAEKGIENSSPDQFSKKFTVAKNDWVKSTSDMYLSYLYDTLGWAHYLRDDFSSATDALRMAVEYSDNVSTEIWSHFAKALSAQGKNAEAVDVLFEILSQEKNREIEELAQEIYIKEHGSLDGFEDAVRTARDRSATPASNFTLFTADQTPLSLIDFRGSVILLNFWFPT